MKEERSDFENYQNNEEHDNESNNPTGLGKRLDREQGEVSRQYQKEEDKEAQPISPERESRHEREERDNTHTHVDSDGEEYSHSHDGQHEHSHEKEEEEQEKEEELEEEEEDDFAVLVRRGGKGRAATHGDTVYVFYRGTLKDGTEFDSNFKEERAFSFELGAGEVIQAWDKAFRGMQRGTQARIIAPADYAFGDQAIGDLIPANSTLIFDVEVVGVRPGN